MIAVRIQKNKKPFQNTPKSITNPARIPERKLSHGNRIENVPGSSMICILFFEFIFSNALH